MAYLLSIGYSDSGKPYELVIGDCKWDHYKIVNMLESFLYKLKNVAITPQFIVVGLEGDVSKYTTYNAKTKRIMKKAYTILAMGSNGDYLVSDGITNPKWMSKEDIIRDVNLNNYGLSNSNIENDEITAIGVDFDIVGN